MFELAKSLTEVFLYDTGILSYLRKTEGYIPHS